MPESGLILTRDQLLLARSWFQFAEAYSPDFIQIGDDDAALYELISKTVGLPPIRNKDETDE